MEIHHHSHHPKKWKEYFIEGLMIFIAVSLGYAAENIRHHFTEKHKAISSVQNLYKDLNNDSVIFSNILIVRSKQDSCFQIISHLYDEKKIEHEIPTLYAAQTFFSMRVMPNTNTMALDHIKNSDALNYIEDENLKQKIQAYSSIATGLKIREQREYNFIDKYMDPLTITWFEYKFYHSISNEDSFEIKGNKIIVKTKIPDDLKLIKQNTFDWNNYFSILGALSTIRKSTDRNYISPSQAECLSLLGQVRAYLKENNALIE